MAQYVQITVKIGGNTISPISYCSINQHIDWHHRFEIVLPTDIFTEKYNAVLNQAKDYVGKKIELSFKAIGPGEPDTLNEFYGIVTEVSLYRRNSGSKEVIIRGYSPTLLLDGKPSCRSFSERTLKKIVSDIHDQIPQNDLKTNIDPLFTSEIPYIVQYKESNFHFLNRIADKFGEWCFYNGKELVFGRLDKTQVIDLPIDKKLSEFEHSLRLQDLNYNAVTYDYLENSAYTQDTKNFSINDLDPNGDHALSQSEKVFKQDNTYFSPENFQNERDFIDFHETRKFTNTKELIYNEGASDHPFINVGSVIKISGDGKQEDDFGEFIIVSINHTIDITGKYVNHFTAIPKQASKPFINRNIITPVSEIQPALVTDNDDPESLGRVKIRFFWQKQSESTPWLRIIHPFGGKLNNGDQHGFYFIPEIGDEVMVGFENNNPDKAFIIGNVYHKNSKPDHWHHAQNNIKSIRTRNGNQIIFIDENGSEEIRILNKDDGSPTNEISLSLNNNGKITIKSVGDLEISAENIKISANTDLTVESGQNTKLKANDYQLDANNGIKLTGQQITVEGQNTTTIKGQSQLELEGTNTSMKGQAELKLEGTQTKIGATQLKIEGNAQVEITGAMVKVAGSAVTEVTGGLVKIN